MTALVTLLIAVCVVILALDSPRFLYREPSSGPLDSYDVASRLSFGTDAAWCCRCGVPGVELWLRQRRVLPVGADGTLGVASDVVQHTGTW